MPERRAHPRKKLVLPVRLKVADDLQFAHTVDIASTGVRLGNVRSEMEVGKIVTLSRGLQKAQFRVAWVQRIGPTEVQAGLEALQPDDSLLGVNLSECERDSSTEMLMTPLTSKPAK